MKKIFYTYADLETTKVNLPKGYDSFTEYYQKDEDPKYPKVYSWGFMYSDTYPKLVKGYNYEHDKERKVHYHCGLDIKEFINLIKELDKDVKIYFNNSKGFDNHFIYPALDEMGFNQIPPIKDSDYKDLPEDYTRRLKILRQVRFDYLFNLIKKSKKAKDMTLTELTNLVEKRWNTLLKNEYRLMVNNNTQILKMSIATNSTYWTMGNKKHRVVNILDNLLLFAGSIKSFGEMIAKYHIKNGMDETKAKQWFHKQEIGYNRTEQYKSIEEFKNDGNEYSYLKQDIYILYEYHNLLEKYFPREEWKLTAASTTYKNWNKDFANEYIPKLIKSKDVKKIKVKNGGYKYEYKKKLYSNSQLGNFILGEILPTKWLGKETEEFATTHQEIYQWYKGGLTAVNEIYRGQYVENVSVIDINSSYPAVMNSKTLIPIGVGQKGDIKGLDFKLYTMNLLEDVRNEKGLPFLTPIFDKKRNYPKTLKKGSIVHLDSFEYERFQKYYTNDKSKYSLKVNWSFATTNIDNLFGFYISKHYETKKQASIEKNDILKQIVKIFLNSLYGKFATKTIRDSRVWDANNKEWIAISDILDPEFYLPVALAITSLARMKLVDACDTNYHLVVYYDTDSLFIIDFEKNEFKNIKLDKFELGLWDTEKVGLCGIARRSKQYLFFELKTEDEDKKRKVAFAGINFNRDMYEEDIEDTQFIEEDLKIVNTLQLIDFVKGRTIHNQTSPYKVLGQGIIIQEGLKNIKPVWEYDPLPEQIYYKEEHFQKVLEKVSNLKF